MKKFFKNNTTTLRRYYKDHSGQFAMWTAIAAFPVLVATSYAVDFRGAEKDRSNIKSALDVAVLTAVSNDKLNYVQKEDLAVDIFKTHYSGSANLTFDVNATDGRVEMSATGMKEASLARSVGSNGFSVKETSIAEMNRQNTICVLALAESGRDKLRFLGGTEFNSPTCSVQSNSRDNQGVFSNSRYQPIAKSFCSAGGAKGDFKPAMRGECRVIEDPYADKRSPKPGLCMPDAIFSEPVEEEGGLEIPLTFGGLPIAGHEPGVHIVNKPPKRDGKARHAHYHCHVDKVKCHVGTHKVGTIHAPSILSRLEGLGVSGAEVNRLERDYGRDRLLTPESTNYTGENAVFYPGTYCGGLTVDGKNVRFTPGTYIIKDGPLTFKNGASADAQDVSFVLSGQDAVVTVESGSYVNIKAPKTGPMAGLAFFQDQHGSKSPISTGRDAVKRPTRLAAADLRNEQTPKKAPTRPSKATGVNLISSGGELNVTGTMYFPTQALDVVGDSVLGAKAPATSFIAYQVTFSGETKAAVSVDHVKGGIPPMLPRSDDGARLVE